jgi:PAS domain S-box-containing protein
MNEVIKILVVEDDAVDRMAIQRALKKAKIKVELVEATDCEGAIALIDQQEFECAFLDYRLPDGNALELIEQLREVGSKVPLVVLTGQGDEEIAVELMKAGASDYLPKNKVSPETLARSLNNAVRLYRAELEAQWATQQLQISEERYRLILEGSNDGIWDWDLTTNQVYGNDRLLKIAGLSPQTTQVSYELFRDLIHPEDRFQIGRLLIKHLRYQDNLEVEFRLRHSSGEYRYCTARGKAQGDCQGHPVRLSGVVSDITERKKTEARSRFLAEATTLLSSSLDYQTTLKNLARLVVPTLADWCAIDVVTDTQTYHRIAVAHANPQKEILIWEMPKQFPVTPEHQYGYPKVLRTGEADACFEVSEEHLREMAQSPAHLDFLRQLSPRSYLCVPLGIGERVLGSMLFVWSESPRHYNQLDLNFVQDLAHRAAFAIDNARLYLEAQKASESLRKAVVILGEQQQQLRTLQRLTNLLNQRLTDLTDLLRVMTREVCDAISGAQVCFITLHNPHRQFEQAHLTVVAGSGAEDLKLDGALSSPSGQLRQVLNTGESQLIRSQTTNSGKFPASLYVIAIESAQSGRLGILGIGNWEDENAFDREDQHLLNAVGEQAAIAIDNARQIKTLEEREDRLEWQNRTLAEQNTELERNRQQIQLQNVQLMEAARLKSQFLATMSHELRTPMNAIIGFSQLLLRHLSQSERSSARQQEWSERILANGKALLSLINDILDLSTIEADRLELQLEKVNLTQLVTTTTEELRSLGEEKDLELNIHLDLANPIVFNDSRRLRQILVNLISNAIKFTEKGTVSITATEKTEDQIEIIVQDTGIGIAKAQLSQIFDAFRQGDQSITRKYAGTGLGLAITQSLVELMDGTISVESQLEQGSTFKIQLPRRLPLSQRGSSGSQPQAHQKTSRVLKKNKPGRLLY